MLSSSRIPILASKAHASAAAVVGAGTEHQSSPPPPLSPPEASEIIAAKVRNSPLSMADPALVIENIRRRYRLCSVFDEDNLTASRDNFRELPPLARHCVQFDGHDEDLLPIRSVPASAVDTRSRSDYLPVAPSSPCISDECTDAGKSHQDSSKSRRF